MEFQQVQLSAPGNEKSKWYTFGLTGAINSCFLFKSHACTFRKAPYNSFKKAIMILQTFFWQVMISRISTANINGCKFKPDSIQSNPHYQSAFPQDSPTSISDVIFKVVSPLWICMCLLFLPPELQALCNPSLTTANTVLFFCYCKWITTCTYCDSQLSLHDSNSWSSSNFSSAQWISAFNKEVFNI
jgi:hypothetical protein